MDEFQYTLLKQEMTTVTTQRASREFLVKITANTYGRNNTITVHHLNLLQEAYEYFKEERPPKWASLPQVMSNNVSKLVLTSENLALLNPLPIVPHTTRKAYRDFMAAAGIPAYMKLAVLKAAKGIQ